MSFFRHAEIYRGEVVLIGAGAASKKYRSLPHPLDESPVGYSSASCSPAGLAYASPTGGNFQRTSFCRTINSQQTVNSVLTTCLTAGAQPTSRSGSSPRRISISLTRSCRLALIRVSASSVVVISFSTDAKTKSRFTSEKASRLTARRSWRRSSRVGRPKNQQPL
jgi:hypothetical protein